MAKDIAAESSTIQKILAAAGQEFSERGFGAARVDEIAKRADVNKATIYYHIGGKETLYGQVLQHVFEHVVTNIAEGLEKIQSPEERLRLYIRHLTHTIHTQPYLPELMMRELASGAQHLPEPVVEEFGYMLEMLTNILQEGEQQGVFMKSSPLLIHFMIIGSNAFLKTSQKLTARYTSETLQALQQAYRDGSPENLSREIEELVLRALGSF